jgi:hypothetical protein
MQRRNRIDQRQGFLRVVPIRAGQTHGERHASTVADQMALAPAAEFLREHLPGNAAAKDKQNAGETRAIGDARPSAFRPTRWSWQERFNRVPQRIGKQRRGHTRSRYFADEDVFRRFLRAL